MKGPGFGPAPGFNSLGPGKTLNIWTPPDHLTQIQHKGNRVDIVDHFDHGENPTPVHIVTRVGGDGDISTDVGE